MTKSKKRNLGIAPKKKQVGKKVRSKDGSAIVHVSPTTAGIVFDGQSLDDWDDEELMQGKRRDKNGHFSGRPAKVIPIQLHKELTRRRFSRAYDLMSDSLVDAALMLRSVVVDKKAPRGVRIRAAEVMFDRILGKPKESVSFNFQEGESGETPKWQKLAANAIIGTVAEAGLYMERQHAAEDEIEGEIVEEDEA